ncbi:hypothetical protein BGZ70_006882 [Mortierella alpina]|uniref:F-box domain-containing protein n=1 Tax=Mortierella alpina TaxID=64518 RepID=A0A9P6JHE4_MORAP|nr:hypothetical protein BGZ70_006882 [Mortierella alpina]
MFELYSVIASYLDPHDFTQLCRVSKHFSQLFRPFLWSVLSNDLRRPWIQGLKRNGHLLKHVKLYSWENTGCCTLASDDDNLAKTLLEHCGDNLTTLAIKDDTEEGRIWKAVVDSIGGRTLKGTQTLNGIRVLNISLTFDAFNSDFRRLLAQPEKCPDIITAFAGVTELTLCGDAFNDNHIYPPWIQVEPRVDLDKSAAIHLQNLVRLFPGVHTLSVVELDIDPSEDGLETGGPSESAAVEARSDYDYYQLQELDFRHCRISVKQVIRILERSRGVRSLSIGHCLMGDANALLSNLPALAPDLTRPGSIRCTRGQR